MKSIIQSPTGNLKASLDFYKKLDYKLIAHETRNLVTDGKAVIEINSEKFARAGIKLYKKDWGVEVEKLEQHTKVRKTDEGYVLSDPSNTWIYLMEEENEITFAQADCFSTLGEYNGISLETMDMERSIVLWGIMGFKQTMGDPEQGWVLYANEEGFAISFMGPNSCPHLFFNPSLTYFNGGKNLPVIEKIRAAGIPITEEITHFNKEGIVDNVILRDPGGLGFFVFND